MTSSPQSIEITNSRKTNSVILSHLKEGKVLINVEGKWTLKEGLPLTGNIEDLFQSNDIKTIAFDTNKLNEWDSSALTFFLKLKIFSTERKIEFEDENLPDGVKKLLSLATTVPPKDLIEEEEVDRPMLSRIGERSIKVTRSTVEMVEFIGDASIALVNFFRGKAKFKKSELWFLIQDAGADALPIVTLINFLIGVIIAFVGAVQLEMFDAQIYVADLVALAMVRELAPMMTAIIIAGRSGAAYAAQIGTMMVNEEVDALNTFGFNSMEFLVIPRLIALTLMMPLLVLYADFVGMIGGAVVGIVTLDISYSQYLEETISALSPMQFFLGLIKGTIYGILVAIAGCLRGMQCGRSASAVGSATTSAVVTGIVFIIVASAVTTVIYNIMGY